MKTQKKHDGAAGPERPDVGTPGVPAPPKNANALSCASITISWISRGYA